MATLSSSAFGKLRCLVSLRSTFVWLLLVLLIAGAASYTSGTRYALVGHGPFQPAPATAASAQNHDAVPPPVAASATPHDQPASAIQAVRIIHQAGPYVEPVELEMDCCERSKAPRGEPSPVKTGAVDPPSLTHRQHDDGMLSSVVPPEPDLPALTVVQLSISRT